MMNWQAILPLLILLSALLTGVATFFVKEAQTKLRQVVNLGGALSCIVLILVLISEVANGAVFEARIPLLPDIDLVLHADPLSLLFVTLSALLWLVTTVYALGYLGDSPNQSRFFAFFSLCVSATIGVALAGNLITFLIFYELLTLTTYPLVVHKGNSASLAAGRKYLIYTMLGGALLLAAVVWLKAIAGPLDFTATGVLASMPDLSSLQLQIIFALLIIGLGVKAALVPLHGWLPAAMAAPAPVSALLHAVAVVKAGAFGIVRVTYDVYGIEFARELGVTLILAIVASITIVYGSLRALAQDDLKKRLAFSTVSQVSYIVLGTAVAGPIGTIGGIAHLVHQGLMKITMFFCAGSITETLGVTKVSQLNGAGKRMPLTMLAFSIAVLGMIGIPPAAGFVSKWYIGTGALESGYTWVLGVLIISSLLNAMYFLPIVYAAWFKRRSSPWPKSRGKSKFETHWMMLFPPLLTASLALIVGMFADASFSPLNWVKFIAAAEYGNEFTTVLSQSVQQIPLLWLPIILPFMFALSLIWRRSHRYCQWYVPITGAVALLTLALSDYGSNITPWLFFGSVMELNQTTMVFFLLSAILWTLVGVFAKPFMRQERGRSKFNLFCLLAMSGNLGLVLAQDVSGFISFFTLMSLASYALVVHSRTEEAYQAGSAYMKWAVLGELLLFTALAGLAYSSIGQAEQGLQASIPSWAVALLLLGFGIKAGLFALHVWLPLAHPVAPVPASALLSGIMVKAGILGWIKFIPFGEVSFVGYGELLTATGLLAAFYGVLIGITQQNPKALLAYSTVSQMGVIIAACGVGLSHPQSWQVILPALLLYIAHHGCAKAALFLSAGLIPSLAHHRRRWLLWLGVIIPALALAGLPLSSGAVAKLALKESVAVDYLLVSLLPFTAVGTTWLVCRYLYLLKAKVSECKQAQPQAGLMLAAYFSLVIVSMLLVYFLPLQSAPLMAQLSLETVWSGLWPLLLGYGLFVVSKKVLNQLEPVPLGDIGVSYKEVADTVREMAKHLLFGWRSLHLEIKELCQEPFILPVSKKKQEKLLSIELSDMPQTLFILVLVAMLVALMWL